MNIVLALILLVQNVLLNEMVTSQNVTTEFLESDTPDVIHEVHDPKLINHSKSGEPIEKTDICYCAVFSTDFPKKEKPILNQTAVARITCDYEAEESCGRNCTIFAKAAKDRAPPVLCYLLGDYNRLMVSVHSRTSCRNSQWTFTGLSLVNPICCKKGKVVKCKAVPKDSKKHTTITTRTSKRIKGDLRK
ncbi:hypothetical protein ILUMI_03543 [Ignelater luminosus]|uniref:Uncharacterized protein n=1 Tax=Ignelater luminosus TaxID=2038154 RepID=A0A8K0GKC9_IGNLU|nr:hypothetical protein ILUMI_03543 [Ignelater luminosus]